MEAFPMEPLTLEAAIIIPVPAAEPVVGPWREQYDRFASFGVPAHITLLYPFLPADRIGDATLDDLKAFFKTASPFSFALDQVATFPEVLYLVPTPSAPFVRLIERLAARYPETPPYRGAFQTIVPHLTVAQLSDRDRLRRVSRRFVSATRSALPIAAHAGEAWLMQGDADGSWSARCALPFGGSVVYS